MANPHLQSSNIFIDTLDKTVNQWTNPKTDIHPILALVMQCPDPNTFLHKLKEKFRSDSLVSSAVSRWSEEFLFYFEQCAQNSTGFSFTRREFAGLCGTDDDTARKWEYAESLADRNQLIRLGLGLQFRKQEINDLLSRYGYRELYPKDPDDLVILFVLNDAEGDRIYTREQSLVTAVEYIKDKLPKRLFIERMWKAHFQEIIQHDPDGLSQFKETQLRNWKNGQTLPRRNELLKVIWAFRLNQDDADLLLTLYCKNGLYHSKNDQDILKKYDCCLPQNDIDMTRSFLYSSTLENFPNGIASSHKKKENSAPADGTLTTGRMASGQLEPLIEYAEEKIWIHDRHTKVNQILNSYMDIWYACRYPKRESISSRAKFCKDFQEFFPYMKVKKKDSAPSTGEALGRRFSNLGKSGILPSRYDIILIAIALEMNLTETNLLLKICHYPPLNLNDRIEYLISHAMMFAYLHSYRNTIENRIRAMEPHMETLNAIDTDWAVILAEHEQTKTNDYNAIPRIPQFIGKVLRYCLDTEEILSASSQKLDTWERTVKKILVNQDESELSEQELFLKNLLNLIDQTN